MSGFELVPRILGPRSWTQDKGRITIQSDGRITFSGTTYKALGSPAAIQILFDRKAQKVAFRGASADAEHAFPIKAPKGPSRVIYAKAFQRLYDLPENVARAYTPRQEGDLLIIDLNEEAKSAEADNGQANAVG